MLFTEDGVYQDGFFGALVGGRPSLPCFGSSTTPEAAISGRFVDPVSDGAIAYARFRFSYASRLPEGMGRPVLFEGISCFRFRGELIVRYSEVFDPGVALVQLTFSAEASGAS